VRIVLDTNVLVSGIFFSGSPSDILKAWRDGVIQIAFTPEMIDEYTRVTRILANEYPDIDINPILTLIIAHSEIFQPSPFPHQVCEDPDDDKFLACAIASESSIIVSGDKHLLKLSGYRGITVLSPRAFVNQYLTK